MSDGDAIIQVRNLRNQFGSHVVHQDLAALKVLEFSHFKQPL